MLFEQVSGLIRHGLTFGAGYLVAAGYATEVDASAIVTGIMAVIGIGWSVWSKRKAKAA